MGSGLSGEAFGSRDGVKTLDAINRVTTMVWASGELVDWVARPRSTNVPTHPETPSIGSLRGENLFEGSKHGASSFGGACDADLDNQALPDGAAGIDLHDEFFLGFDAWEARLDDLEQNGAML